MGSIVKSGSLFLATVVLACLVCSSVATDYKVGDSEGWVLGGKTNYKQWAASKKFQIGDTITFVYEPKAHNVLEVTKKDFDSCNASSPLATHDTGNDVFHITKKGHYFYICGFVGHCKAGQKVDIRVVPSPPTPTPAAPTPSAPAPGAAATTAPAPSPASSVKAPAPAPANGSAPALSKGVAGMFAMALAVLGVLAF